MASQAWNYDVAFNYLSATTVTATGITAIVPDYTFGANQLTAGSKLRATIYGKITTAASSPGTVTFQAMWGGTGGTSLVSSGALTYVASATNIPFRLEFLIVCTAIGSLFCQGWFWTTTAVLATPAHAPLPASAPAVTSGLTFSSAEALDFNSTMSASGNTIVTNLYTLESMAL